MQEQKEIFAEWLTAAREFAAGARGLTYYAEATAEASALLRPSSSAASFWTPLEHIIAAARKTHPHDVEQGLLAQDSMLHGYPRFEMEAVVLLEMGGRLKGEDEQPLLQAKKIEEIKRSISSAMKKLSASQPNIA